MASYLITQRGTISAATVGEIFSFSHGVIATMSQDAVAAAVNTAWKNMWNGTPTVKNYTGSAVSYTESTAALITNLSTGELQAATHVAFSPVLNSAGTNMLPSQNAICVSTIGGPRPNGTPYKGRFYLPTPAQGAVDSPTGYLLSPDTRWRDPIKVYFDACISAGAIPAIWSRANGTLSPIVSFKVGDRVDTIRRRRNSKAEVYSASPV